MDEQELQRFYQEKVGAVYRYVYSQVGNREDAEDLTSEIFLKAVRSIHQELGPQRIRKWLFLIARTIVADYWRARYRTPTSSLEPVSNSRSRMGYCLLSPFVNWKRYAPKGENP
jgi:RNA polymerase sigma-70 factor (ECF subfamily)